MVSGEVILLKLEINLRYKLANPRSRCSLMDVGNSLQLVHGDAELINDKSHKVNRGTMKGSPVSGRAGVYVAFEGPA